MAFADPGSQRQIIDAGQYHPWTDVARGQSLPVNSADGILAEPKVTLAAAVVKGDVLGYSSGWVLALATVGTAIQGRLVALEDAASGAQCRVSPNPIVSGYTGATPGNYVYVAEGTDSGEITETAPTTSGDCNTIIGVALAADTVMFFINSRADTTV